MSFNTYIRLFSKDANRYEFYVILWSYKYRIVLLVNNFLIVPALKCKVPLLIKRLNRKQIHIILNVNMIISCSNCSSSSDSNNNIHSVCSINFILINAALLYLYIYIYIDTINSYRILYIVSIL